MFIIYLFIIIINPPAPRSWQTLEIEDMTSKSRMELLRAELASLGKTLTTVQEHSILDHCDECNCSPIYVVLLANDIARYTNPVAINPALRPMTFVYR